MVHMSGEGSLTAGASVARWDTIRPGLRKPGMTVIIAPNASGKTHFANRLTKESQPGQTLLISGEDLHRRDLDQVMTELVSRRAGELVIIDDLGGLEDRAAAEVLRTLLRNRSSASGHVLLMLSRPIPAIEALLRDRRVPYNRFDFTQSVEELELRLHESPGVSAQDAEALLRLMRSSAHDIELAGDLLSAAHSRLADDLSGGPDLAIVPDRSGKLRVVPSTDLGSARLALAPGQALSATPIITYRSTRRFWLPEASKLEALINDPSVREQDLQSFFEESPHLLAGVSYDRVVPHPVLSRDQDGPLIPDFMLEPAGGFADVLDLKLPSSPVAVGRRDRVRQSAAVTEAVAQVREYRAYFDDPVHREAVRERYGLDAFRPTVAVVIGRDPKPGHDRLQLKRVWDDLPAHVRLMTYDELLRQVRRLAKF
jgi:Shedu protein SduA, C-terminal